MKTKDFYSIYSRFFAKALSHGDWSDSQDEEIFNTWVEGMIKSKVEEVIEEATEACYINWDAIEDEQGTLNKIKQDLRTKFLNSEKEK